MQIHSGSFKGTAVTAFAAFAIGAVAWSGHLFTLLGLLALPIVFKCAKGTPQRITTLGLLLRRINLADHAWSSSILRQ